MEDELGKKWVMANFKQRSIFVMVKCRVLFEVRTEFPNIIKTSIGFRRLICYFIQRINELKKESK
jgi:hypothetical protein